VFLIILAGDGEVVVVDEVVAGLVGRIDIDHLDLPEAVLLEELAGGLEVVALDVEVLGGIEIDGLLHTRAQGLANGGIGKRERLAFPGPVEPVAFLWPFRGVIGKCLAKQVEVDCALQRAVRLPGLSDTVWKEFGQPRGVGSNEVRGLEVEFVHGKDEL